MNIMTIRPKERFRGSLLGLAIGDALGAPVEFKSRGTFNPIVDFESGGTWGLPPGYWTWISLKDICGGIGKDT
jgi:ADP-ribosyl-[dinitrogen reductase] hydrolase